MPIKPGANKNDRNDSVYRSSPDMEWIPNPDLPGGGVWSQAAGGLAIPSGEMRLRELGVSDVSNYANYSQLNPIFRAGAQRQVASNPYSNVIADQSRPMQLALLQQMRAQQAGPSVANMQSQQAFGQNMQNALGAGAGRGAMLQARNVGAGLAGDTGQARLAEQLRLASSGAGGANALRGGDLSTAQQGSQFGISAQQQADARARMYAALGRQLDESRAQRSLETIKAGRNYDKLKKDQIMGIIGGAAGSVAGAIG